MAPSRAPRPISRQVARRYLLGRQGLWPGRRWSGKGGAALALHALGSVQMDPITVVARSHDLVLWNRVTGYEPAHLDGLLYGERAFFDYGGHLDIHPMEELPYWRPHMRRRLADERQAAFVAEHGALVAEVLAKVRSHGPLTNREVAGSERVASYRGRNVGALALYHLWLTGELMTHSRRGFERRYDLRERIAPPHLDHEATEQEVTRHFALEALRTLGLGTLRAWAGSVGYGLHDRIDRRVAADRLADLIDEGEAATVIVEGRKETYYLPAGDVPLIDDLSTDRLPAAWQAVDGTTTEEVNFLSPLDNLLQRERTLAIFGFEYLWEVYKPAAQRRWGSYTMPVLYGDSLVARLEPKRDRTSSTLRIDGYWPEGGSTAASAAFPDALARGLTRFARFHGVATIGLDTLQPVRLRDHVRKRMEL